MRIERLELKNFRNIDALDISDLKGVVFFTGENGSGKTNILESISIASQLKSFRNADDRDMIQWNEDGFFVSITDDKKNTYEVGFSNQEEKLKKKTKMNGNEVIKASDYYSRLMTVCCGPEDAALVNGTHESRRKYIDSVIAKMSGEYIRLLNEFRKILTSRNTLLKEIKEGRKKESDLDVWDDIFSDRASIIMKKRHSCMDVFSVQFRKSYERISDMKEIPDIVYRPNMNDFDSGSIFKSLEKGRKKDIAFGSSLHGPHRDHYLFVKNDMEISSYGSQGQIRIAAIALKCAEKRMIEEVKNEKSILVVDDIFSELDEKRRGKLVTELSSGNQVFFSMVKADESICRSFDDIDIYEVSSGKVRLCI